MNQTPYSQDSTHIARSALLWVLWHHQGANSDVGQPIRFALGIGRFDRLSEADIHRAKMWGDLMPQILAEDPQSTEDLAHELWAMAQGSSIEESVKAIAERMAGAIQIESIVGLGKDDALAVSGDIDQGVAMPATSAQEVAANLIDLRGDEAEKHLQATGSALPHGADGTAISTLPPTAITAEEAGREGDGWLPIETAPKDRRILLGYAPDADHEDGYVAEGRWWEGYDDAPDDMGSDGGFMDSEFQFFRCPRSFGAEQYRTKGLQPTHWQLLHPAPAQMPQPEPTSKGACDHSQKEIVSYWACVECGHVPAFDSVPSSQQREPQEAMPQAEPTDEQILSCLDGRQPVREHHGAAVFEYRLFALVDFARRVLALSAPQEAGKVEPVACWVDRTELENMKSYPDCEPTVSLKPVDERDVPLYLRPTQQALGDARDAARWRFTRDHNLTWFVPTKHWRVTDSAGKAIHEGRAETYEQAVDAAILAAAGGGEK